MRTQLQDQPGALREITGGVSSAGAIIAGTGFTVTKAGTGAYQIRFPPFRGHWASTAAVMTQAGGFAVTGGDGVGMMQVNTYNSAANGADLGFDFSVKGLAR